MHCMHELCPNRWGPPGLRCPKLGVAQWEGTEARTATVCEGRDTCLLDSLGHLPAETLESCTAIHCCKNGAACLHELLDLSLKACIIEGQLLLEVSHEFLHARS